VRPAALPVLLVASAISLASNVEIARWYLSDGGWLPSGFGSSLVDRAGATTALALGLCGLVAVISAWLLRNRLPALSCAVVAGLALSAIPFFAYPHASAARFVVLDPTTGRGIWSVSAHNVRSIDGMLGLTGTTLLVAAWRQGAHTCAGVPVTLSVDLALHRVTAITERPQYTSSPPALPKALDPARYRVIAGHSIRRCSS
jgi:hypothetical protein